MIDGCPDGWGGTGIPVCAVASGAAQQEGNSPRASRDGMKERDYIGLGLATQEQGSYPQNAGVLPAPEKMECDKVELSLGLGPPEKSTQQPAHMEHLLNMGSQPDHVDTQAKLKLASPSAKSQQHFWHHTFRVNLSNNEQLQSGNLQVEVSNCASVLKNYTPNAPAWGSVPGRFAAPTPKVSTIPAKRPFLEAVGERRSLSSIPNHVVSVDGARPCAMPVPAGIYTWNRDPAIGNVAPVGLAWQGHASMDQGPNHTLGGIVSSAFIHPRQLGVVPPPPPPHFKVPQAGVCTPPPSIIKSSSALNGASAPAQEVADVRKAEIEDESNANRTPVVGWPPVRSFRKNFLQAAQTSQTSSEDIHTKKAGGPSNGGLEGVEHGSVRNSKNAFFVKVKLDGVRIGRKVDLKAYESYDELKSALQDMFQGFVSDNTKLDLLHGNNYVVTHEDKDGDCLLVGDVPWPMFVESSVRSLRIMKSMDAISIGDKAAKLRAQANGNP